MAGIVVTMDVGKLIEQMDASVSEFMTALPRTMERIGLLMQDTAQGRVPVRTGHLKSSITHREGTEGLVYYAEVGSNVEYAPYVEYGTGDTGEASPGGRWYGDHPSGVSYTAGWPGQRAQPYLRPAVYDMEPMYRQMILDELRRAMR